jgi:hypothetical protein
MAHIVETSEEDSWLCIAKYVADLIDAGEVRRALFILWSTDSNYRLIVHKTSKDVSKTRILG